MKITTRRLLAGTTLVLAATLSACSFHGHDADSRAERADWFAERISGKLDLDSAQRARLEELKTVLVETREKALAERNRAQDELQALLAGDTIDRERALGLVNAHTAFYDGQAAPVITAFADFYESLNPEQQAHIREKLQGFEGRHGRHHPFH